MLTAPPTPHFARDMFRSDCSGAAMSVSTFSFDCFSPDITARGVLLMSAITHDVSLLLRPLSRLQSVILHLLISYCRPAKTNDNPQPWMLQYIVMS